MSEPPLPSPTLTTDRTVLRPFSPKDAAGLVLLFREPAVRKYLLDDQLVSASWVDAEISASQQRFESGEAGLWTISLRGDPAIVGFVGFRPFFDPAQLQLLYGLLPDFWGKGLATECAARVCQFAFQELDFDGVVAAVDVPNRASARVLERLGMSLERTTSEGTAGTTFYRVERASFNA